MPLSEKTRTDKKPIKFDADSEALLKLENVTFAGPPIFNSDYMPTVFQYVPTPLFTDRLLLSPKVWGPTIH